MPAGTETSSVRVLRTRPHTVTVGARLLDDLALSGAFRAGARSLDHADRRALLHLDLACAAAVGARFRRGAAFGAAAAACLAFFQALHLYLALTAFGRLHEGQPDCNIDIIAADRRVGIACTCAAAKSAETAAKKAFENIPDIKAAETAAKASRAACARAIGRVHARVAELIVPLTLRGVAEDLVCLVDLLDFASAVLSPGFRSGWYFFASLRYAFFKSSAEASFATPSTS